MLNEKKDFSPTEGFLRDFLSQLDTHLKDKERPRRVVSLGVGRFSECPIARTQLAFLLAVRDSFSGNLKMIVTPNTNLSTFLHQEPSLFLKGAEYRFSIRCIPTWSGPCLACWAWRRLTRTARGDLRWATTATPFSSFTFPTAPSS